MRCWNGSTIAIFKVSSPRLRNLRTLWTTQAHFQASLTQVTPASAIIKKPSTSSATEEAKRHMILERKLKQMTPSILKYNKVSHYALLSFYKAISENGTTYSRKRFQRSSRVVQRNETEQDPCQRPH